MAVGRMNSGRRREPGWRPVAARPSPSRPGRDRDRSGSVRLRLHLVFVAINKVVPSGCPSASSREVGHLASFSRNAPSLPVTTLPRADCQGTSGPGATDCRAGNAGRSRWCAASKPSRSRHGRQIGRVASTWDVALGLQTMSGQPDGEINAVSIANGHQIDAISCPPNRNRSGVQARPRHGPADRQFQAPLHRWRPLSTRSAGPTTTSAVTATNATHAHAGRAIIHALSHPSNSFGKTNTRRRGGRRIQFGVNYYSRRMRQTLNTAATSTEASRCSIRDAGGGMRLQSCVIYSCMQRLNSRSSVSTSLLLLLLLLLLLMLLLLLLLLLMRLHGTTMPS